MTWTAKQLANMDKTVLEMNDIDFIQHTKTKLEGLPRSQRRAKERELKDNMLVMKSLNPKQMRLMVDCVNHACGRAVQDEMDKYNIMMDTAITAYLYIKYPDMTIEQAREEQEIIAELITEDLVKYMDRLKKEDGDENMANKKVNKMEPEVREYSSALIEKGFNQSEAIKELCIKFPTLSRSMLTNAFKKVKEEQRIEKEAQSLEVATEVIEAAEYIFGEDKQEEVVEVETEAEETVEVVAEVMAEVNPIILDEEYKDMVEHSKNVEEIAEVTVTATEEDDLKIISRKIEIQGKFNSYVINEDHVQAGIKAFTSLEDVEVYMQEQMDLFNKEMAELKKVVGMI